MSAHPKPHVWTCDVDAGKYLLSRGFKLTDNFDYYRDEEKEPNDLEWSALLYMIHEWDYSYIASPVWLS